MWYCVASSLYGLMSCCLFACAPLVRRGPDVRSLCCFPANVRNAVMITAQCPGLWLRSCAGVCCRSPYPPPASSPSQRLTRFSRPGVSPDRQYLCLAGWCPQYYSSLGPMFSRLAMGLPDRVQLFTLPALSSHWTCDGESKLMGFLIFWLDPLQKQFLLFSS